MVDRYTKVCLTVIAVSLAVIGLRGLPMIDPARAQVNVHKIAICDEEGSDCAKVGRAMLGVNKALYIHNIGK